MVFLKRVIGAGLARALTPAAMADKLPLSEISAYLNDLKTAQATITQINDDGSVNTGKLLLKRPGRMRFEYDPPEELLVIAGGGQIGIFDGKSNVTRPEQYPLNRTPLKIILERTVDLAQRNMVVGHSFDGTATTVVAQDPAHPEYGSIELKFTAGPTELRQWIVKDGQGATTTVILGGLETGVRFNNNNLFSLTAEIASRGG